MTRPSLALMFWRRIADIYGGSKRGAAEGSDARGLGFQTLLSFDLDAEQAEWVSRDIHKKVPGLGPD